MFLIIWLLSVICSTRALFEMSTYELLYGDLTNLEKMFPLPFNTTVDNTPELGPRQDKRSPFAEMLDKLVDDSEILDSYDQRYDIQDFNAINMEFKNFTRKRHYERYWYEYDIWDYYTPNVHERKKKLMLLNANMHFLIHTRYKIAIAIRLRNVVKHDKRYKLGYLFARLRHLLTAQRKMAASAEGNRHSYYHHNLYVLMRLYEKVARLDVDIRDTSQLIRDIYGERAIIDKLY